MLKVTSLQCRRARGLLGWNQRDLTHKSGVGSHRINSFERALIHLRQDENKAIYDAFKEEGIVFQEYGEVTLDLSKAGKRDKEDNEKQHIYQNFEAQDVVVNEEEYRRLSGLDALSADNATVQRSSRYLRAPRREDENTAANA